MSPPPGMSPQLPVSPDSDPARLGQSQFPSNSREYSSTQHQLPTETSPFCTGKPSPPRASSSFVIRLPPHSRYRTLLILCYMPLLYTLTNLPWPIQTWSSPLSTHTVYGDMRDHTHFRSCSIHNTLGLSASKIWHMPSYRQEFAQVIV